MGCIPSLACLLISSIYFFLKVSYGPLFYLLVSLWILHRSSGSTHKYWTCLIQLYVICSVWIQHVKCSNISAVWLFLRKQRIAVHQLRLYSTVKCVVSNEQIRMYCAFPNFVLMSLHYEMKIWNFNCEAYILIHGMEGLLLVFKDMFWWFETGISCVYCL